MERSTSSMVMMTGLDRRRLDSSLGLGVRRGATCGRQLKVAGDWRNRPGRRWKERFEMVEGEDSRWRSAAAQVGSGDEDDEPNRMPILSTWQKPPEWDPDHMTLDDSESSRLILTVRVNPTMPHSWLVSQAIEWACVRSWPKKSSYCWHLWSVALLFGASSHFLAPV
jgi:hypothetical protein